jgi:hypothetical protein
MTTIDHSAPPRATGNEDHARRRAARAARGARMQLISDAVVASYIHDISERHRAPRPLGDFAEPDDRVDR